MQRLIDKKIAQSIPGVEQREKELGPIQGEMDEGDEKNDQPDGEPVEQGIKERDIDQRADQDMERNPPG